MRTFFFKHILKSLALFALILLSCSTGHQDQVLYKVEIGDYDVVVSGEGVLEAKNAQVLVTPAVRPEPTISYLVEEGTQVKKGDVVVKFTQTQIENEYVEALDEIATARADSIKTEAELNLELLTYETQYNTAKASADAARLQAANLQFEAPLTREIKQLEIEQFELQAETARKNLESLKKIQQEERLNAQLVIRQALNNVDRAKTQLAQLILRAPFDGIVVHEINRITDEKVQEGNTLFRRMPVVRIPDLSVMQVKLYISETDAQRLTIDMPAKVTIPSLGQQEYDAKVTKVDRIAKAIRRDSKVKKVEVIVELNSTSPEVRPGLTAIANVFIKRACNVIPLPFESVFENDSTRIVYVKEKNHYSPRSVASLYQDADFMIVYGDLQEGDMLALREPANTKVAWPESLSKVQIPAEIDTFKIEKKEPPPEDMPPFPPGMMQGMPGQSEMRMPQSGTDIN